MSENNAKKNIPEKVNIFDQIFSSKKIINPKRDWTIIITLAILFMLFDLVFDFLMYREITSGEMYVTVPASEINVESLNTDEIKNLINDYESRKTEIQTMKPENLVDPSL